MEKIGYLPNGQKVTIKSELKINGETRWVVNRWYFLENTGEEFCDLENDFFASKVYNSLPVPKILEEYKLREKEEFEIVEELKENIQKELEELREKQKQLLEKRIDLERIEKENKKYLVDFELFLKSKVIYLFQKRLLNPIEFKKDLLSPKEPYLYLKIFQNKIEKHLVCRWLDKFADSEYFIDDNSFFLFDPSPEVLFESKKNHISQNYKNFCNSDILKLEENLCNAEVLKLKKEMERTKFLEKIKILEEREEGLKEHLEEVQRNISSLKSHEGDLNELF